MEVDPHHGFLQLRVGVEEVAVAVDEGHQNLCSCVSMLQILMVVALVGMVWLGGWGFC